jgi:hypothetical protein
MDTTAIVILSAGSAVLMALVAILLRLLSNSARRSTTAAPAAPRASTSVPSLSPSGALKLNPSGGLKLSQSAALKQMQAAAAPQPAQAAERFVRVAGHSGTSRNPRELDLTSEGDEIHLHVHQHGDVHTKVWVTRAALQAALERWNQAGGHLDRLVVAGRTARKELPVTLVFHDDGEVEVQADWWIRMGTQELKTALQRLGLRVP